MASVEKKRWMSLYPVLPYHSVLKADVAVWGGVGWKNEKVLGRHKIKLEQNSVTLVISLPPFSSYF